jgi:hypothetical protein
MSSISNLPNELILNILGNVANEDIDSFTSSCSAIRNLATDIMLKHHIRKKKYSKIVYGDPTM